MAIVNTFFLPTSGWAVTVDGVLEGVYPSKDAARFAANHRVALDANPEDRLLAYAIIGDEPTHDELRDAAERLIALSLENAYLRAGKEA